MPVFRRLGFRTATEIDHERYAIKALRGDFNNRSSALVEDREDIQRVMKAVDARSDDFAACPDRLRSWPMVSVTVGACR